MKDIVPSSRPQLKLADAMKIIDDHKVTDHVVFLGIRGYYENSMGQPGKNDRGIYDDAMFIISPTAFLSVNANVDPSAWRKGIASLVPGVWRYKPGTHGLSHPVGPRRYPAFVQAAPVTVARDSQGSQTGMFGINLHHGSMRGTSSLGCQTIHPTQWSQFKELGYSELKRYGQKDFPYILVNG